MKKINEIREKLERSPRWWLVLIGAGVALMLGLTLETGRLHAQATGFSFRGALVRVLTPNGDGRNDRAILCFENPKDSAVSGTVFDVRGQEVGGMVHIQDPGAADATVNNCRGQFPPSGALAQAEALTWDGLSAGRRVTAGVYIYQIKSEDATVTGTIVVVR
jgi:hypothetical protein